MLYSPGMPQYGYRFALDFFSLIYIYFITCTLKAEHGLNSDAGQKILRPAWGGPQGGFIQYIIEQALSNGEYWGFIMGIIQKVQVNVPFTNSIKQNKNQHKYQFSQFLARLAR